MPVPKLVHDAVARALKSEMRKGQTTKHNVTVLAMNSACKGGTGYHIPAALQHMVAMQIFAGEADRQLKMGLPDNVLHHVLANAPPELAQVMPKLPAWICLGEGKNAIWVPSLKATAQQWMQNAAMKHKKARQTQSKGDASTELAQYLLEYGLDCLGASLSMREAAE